MLQKNQKPKSEQEPDLDRLAGLLFGSNLEMCAKLCRHPHIDDFVVSAIPDALPLCIKEACKPEIAGQTISTTGYTAKVSEHFYRRPATTFQDLFTILNSLSTAAAWHRIFSMQAAGWLITRSDLLFRQRFALELAFLCDKYGSVTLSVDPTLGKFVAGVQVHPNLNPLVVTGDDPVEAVLTLIRGLS